MSRANVGPGTGAVCARAVVASSGNRSSSSTDTRRRRVVTHACYASGPRFPRADARVGRTRRSRRRRRSFALRPAGRPRPDRPPAPVMNRTTIRARVRRLHAGFTLIEIMVVIVILGLLATLVATNVEHVSDTARETKARTDVKLLADAVRRYYAQNGKLPASLEVLAARNEKGQSEIEELPKDPWDHDYEWRAGNAAGEWAVLSLGPDGVPSADDISSRAKPD